MPRAQNTIETLLMGIVLEPLPDDISGRHPGCPKTGCWSHRAKVYSDGYRRVSLAGGAQRFYRLHRLVYEHLRGPIPEGMVPDHLCRNRGCCNPDHLEPVTMAVNTLRGNGPSARRAAQTHCIRGHALFGENLYVQPNGERKCRECRRQRERKYRADNPELKRERDQDYREKNREKCRQRTQSYRERNREKCRESVRQWKKARKVARESAGDGGASDA